MNEPLRDPEALLARLKTEGEEEPVHTARKRGRLKIFFGYAAGIGKTYSMLEAARLAAMSERHVLVGYVERHGRTETEALLLGLDLLPVKVVDCMGVKLREFDLDGALRLHPELILVDELAHSNAAGCRHSRRCQDIEELRQAGIDVWTTLNVQHLESLNDVVAQITGVTVRETVPDSVFDEADEVELVDLPPDDLLARFREGKVYVPEQAERAAERFFRKANLIALREIATRRVADRVGREVQSARLGHTRVQVWATHESLMVCVGPSPSSGRVIRAAKRLAMALNAPWVAVHTQSATAPVVDEAGQTRLAQHFKLAEQLGAETATLTGADIADEIIRFAQAHNVTKLVVGKSGSATSRLPWRRSLVDRLLAKSGDIDVYVIQGSGSEFKARRGGATRTASAGPRDYVLAALLLAIATGVSHVFSQFTLGEANIIMSFVLAVVLAADRLGRGPAIFVSVTSMLLFNFFFTDPRFTFVVHDTRYLYTFAIMLAVAFIITALATRVRSQIRLARDLGRRNELMYRLSKDLARTSGRHQLATVAGGHAAQLLSGVVALFIEEDGVLRPHISGGGAAPSAPVDLEAAKWVLGHQQPAGLGTDTLSGASAMYVPLVGTEAVIGVLAWWPARRSDSQDREKLHLIEALAAQTALAIERELLTHEAHNILAEAELERTRNSLLSAVSHDLRTPLAAIVGSAGTLVDSELDVDSRKELARNIRDESDRLSRLVENLLHLTRLDSGGVRVEKHPQRLDEVIGSALRRMQPALTGRPVEVVVPRDAMSVPFDGLLVELVLQNLLDNAGKYSAPGTPITITVIQSAAETEVRVKDRGPGLSDAEKKRIFERFYRGMRAAGGPGRGAGLGLAICHSVIKVHGGRIWAEDRPGGGSEFAFTLPHIASMETPAVSDAQTPRLHPSSSQGQGHD